MREILFRGKRIDNGEWVEGHFIEQHTPVYHAYIVPYIMIEQDNRHTDILEHWIEEVDPDTVGQYTGLKDKAGKKIFDGDLLNGFRYPFLSDNAHNYFAEVVWFDNSPAFGLVTHKNPLSAVRGISAGNADYMEDFDPSNWEVIGNIHDDPELLGGDADA